MLSFVVFLCLFWWWWWLWWWLILICYQIQEDISCLWLQISALDFKFLWNTAVNKGDEGRGGAKVLLWGAVAYGCGDLPGQELPVGWLHLGPAALSVVNVDSKCPRPPQCILKRLSQTSEQVVPIWLCKEMKEWPHRVQQQEVFCFKKNGEKTYFFTLIFV